MLSIIKKADYVQEEHQNDFEIDDDELITEWRELSKKCAEDEMVVIDVVSISDEEMLELVNLKINEYESLYVAENGEDDGMYHTEVDYQNLILLKDILK